MLPPSISGKTLATSASLSRKSIEEELSEDQVTRLDSEEEPDDWSPTRRKCHKVMKSAVTEIFIALCIIVNFAMVVIETDASVGGGDTPGWLRYVEKPLLIIYLVELSARVYINRSRFCHNLFNIMDLVVILVEVGGELFGMFSDTRNSSASFLRIFRLARLARGVKVVIAFPQLALLVKGMVRAVSAIFWGSILLMGALAMLGILAVQFIHPLNQKVAQSGMYEGCDRCERAFSSVGQSMLTFVQQIVAGDSWGLVTIPIIEEQPLSAFFFAFVFVVVSLAVMNVILSVIVDNAAKASDEDLQEVLRAKDLKTRRAAKLFKAMCNELDTDQSGDLTFEELNVGFELNAKFREHLASLDIRREDLGLVFSVLDTDRSGTVNYNEFTEELFKMKMDNTHTLLVFIRFYVLEIRKGVQEQLRVLKSDILDKISAEGKVFLCAQKKEKDSSSHVASKAEPEQKCTADTFDTLAASTLQEELQKLRTVINEDLIHRVQDLAENHKDLVRSITRDVDTQLKDTPMRLTGVLSGQSPLERGAVCKQSRGAPAEQEGPERLSNVLSVQSLLGPSGTCRPRSAWASEHRWTLSGCSPGRLNTRDEEEVRPC